MNAACVSSARRQIESRDASGGRFDAPGLKVDDAPEAQHAFEDSRRLTGANRYFATPAVVLVPLGPAAADGAAQGRWIAQVVSMCASLSWPAPNPRVHAHASGLMLAFAAPPDTLFTATDELW